MSTYLRHDDNQGHLSYVHALPTHVWARDDLASLASRRQTRVVRDEVVLERCFEYGVPPASDPQLGGFFLADEHGADVPLVLGNDGEGVQAVKGSQGLDSGAKVDVVLHEGR